MNEEEQEQGNAEEDTGEGVQSAADAKVEQLNAETERINEAVAENENAKAREKLGGKSEAGGEPIKPKEETPKEYNERIEKEISEGKHDD